MVTDDAEKATKLNTFFSSVFTLEKEGYADHDFIVSKISQDVPLWLTEAGVKKRLDKHSTNKSPVPGSPGQLNHQAYTLESSKNLVGS